MHLVGPALRVEACFAGSGQDYPGQRQPGHPDTCLGLLREQQWQDNDMVVCGGGVVS